MPKLLTGGLLVLSVTHLQGVRSCAESHHHIEVEKAIRPVIWDEIMRAGCDASKRDSRCQIETRGSPTRERDRPRDRNAFGRQLFSKLLGRKESQLATTVSEHAELEPIGIVAILARERHR